ncbi:MAG: iron uptake porin [Cyanobacteria bacterium P01_G01_bin.49]
MNQWKLLFCFSCATLTTLLATVAKGVDTSIFDETSLSKSPKTTTELLTELPPSLPQIPTNQFKPRLRHKTFSTTPQSMNQVTNVSELQDISPTAWAYEALRSLVERYGCIVGYPDRTFRGERSLTRWEFAAGLNACLNTIERLLQENVAVLREDIEKLKRLAQEFEQELVALGARISNLEKRTAYLEDHQFSTTTKLKGDIVFNLAEAFGEDINNGTGNRELDAQTVFTSKMRLQLVTSFSGEDQLITRLTSGSIGNSFQNEIGDFEGRFSFDLPLDNNDVIIDRLHYYFPVGDNLKIYAMASLAGHHFYADTFNSGLEAGGGGGGALSRFGERNPLYRLGLGGRGLAFTYELNDTFRVAGGYMARNGNEPDLGRGLFNGNYSAFGQLEIQPTDTLKFGFSYLNGYDPNIAPNARTGQPNQLFLFGATGTLPGNFQLANLGVPNRPILSNSYGVQGQWDALPELSIRAWGGYTTGRLIGLGTAEVWNYALILAFPDLGKEGSMGAIIVGAEPYMGGLNIPNRPANFTNDTPFHVEVSYKYQINDYISLTPGFIVLTAPNQDSSNNDTVVIGAFRTNFQF